MFINTRLAICLLLIFFASTTLADRQEAVAAGWRSPLITAAAVDEKVRFSSPGGIAQIRVQILSTSGDSLFDSAWKDGNVLDWSPGQPMANGSYRCVVAVRDLEGQVTQKEATVIAEGGQLVIEQRAGAEGLTIVGPDEKGPKITLLVHDGANGAIVSTSGDLSFRFGNFLAGKESERMRLTADGNLGIGTDKPQAKLDVNGMIRASEGIMFSDGTILRTSDGEVVIEKAGANPNGRGRIVETVVRSQPTSIPRRLKPSPTVSPDYQFKVDATGVHIGTTNAFGLDVAGDVTLSSNLNLPATASASAGVIILGANRFAHSFGSFNTFLGDNAGNFTMTGGANTAIGNGALDNNTTGNDNTATGYYALVANTAGGANTAIGNGALFNNTTGNYNTASGRAALHANTTGNSNTAVGTFAIENTTGSNNIAIGFNAGDNLTTGNNNIDIGNVGVAAEANTIRLGTGQGRAFIAGIRGITTGAADAMAVVIDSNGQLGTVSSSRRYKFDIADMGDATADVMRLRPVTFRYLAHGDQAPLQYGLIAEEVAKIYPEMVTRNENGQPDAVMYQFLAPMLLNEVQRQRKTIETLEQRLEQLEARLARGK